MCGISCLTSQSAITDKPMTGTINQFTAYVASMERPLSRMVDMSADIIHGQGTREDKWAGDPEPFDYVALTLKDLSNGGLDKDSLDKLYSIMAFFVDNVITSGNIYLTNRNGKLVIEIAW
jgi:hypothetical protein